MPKQPPPTSCELQRLLTYDRATGKLLWRERPVELFHHCGDPQRIANSWNSVWAGKEAGNLNREGYVLVTVYAVHYRAQRLIWCMVYGEWPSGQIDHLNGIRNDNRLANLADVSHSVNQRNMRKSRANTSGVTGVYWCKHTGMWRAEISIRHGRIRLGRYASLDEAAAAVAAKRSELGFSDRHGQEGVDYDAWRARH